METPKPILSLTLEELDKKITDCCMPFAEIYHNKPSPQLSEDEMTEASLCVINETFRISFSLFSQETYSPEESTKILNKLTETTQKLCKYFKDDLIIRNYAATKLNIKPSSIVKMSDWAFKFLSINDHWILTDIEGKKYHIKTALKTLHYLRGSFLNEIFMYKILEYLGFGPKAEAVFIKEFKTLYTITHDLNKNDSEKDQEIKFVTGQQQKTLGNKDEKHANDLLAVNFLVDFFELHDVYGRETNYGIRKIFNKDTKSLVEKPMIIDFHLKITWSCLSNFDIIQKYVYKYSREKVFLLGLNLSQINRDDLNKIVKSFDNEASIGTAIEDAFKYTKEIHQEINLALGCENILSQPQKEYFEDSKCSIGPVEKLKEYYLLKWKELKLKLAPIKERVSTIPKEPLENIIGSP